MRSLLAGLLTTTLLLTATSAQAIGIANASHHNWTETWVLFDGDEFFVDEFDFDRDSQYDLVPPGEPIILDDFIVSFDGTSVVGAVVEIVIPNFFDPLPRKEIEVVFHGLNGGAGSNDLPRVLDIIGADAPFHGPPGPAVPVIGQFVSALSEPTTHIEHWVLFPNPDFETVKVFIPTTFEFESMHIFTESVPEPAALALLGSGLLGLLVVGRRRAA